MLFCWCTSVLPFIFSARYLAGWGGRLFFDGQEDRGMSLLETFDDIHRLLVPGELRELREAVRLLEPFRRLVQLSETGVVCCTLVQENFAKLSVLFQVGIVKRIPRPPFFCFYRSALHHNHVAQTRYFIFSCQPEFENKMKGLLHKADITRDSNSPELEDHLANFHLFQQLLGIRAVANKCMWRLLSPHGRL